MNHSSFPEAPDAQTSAPAPTRRAPRFALSLPLVLHDDEGSAYRVDIVNLSTGGLQLRCDASTALRLNHPRAPDVFRAALPAAGDTARESLVGLRRRYLLLARHSGEGLMGCDFVGLRPVAARRLRAMAHAAPVRPDAVALAGESGVEIGDEGAANTRNLVL